MRGVAGWAGWDKKAAPKLRNATHVYNAVTAAILILAPRFALALRWFGANRYRPLITGMDWKRQGAAPAVPGLSSVAQPAAKRPMPRREEPRKWANAVVASRNNECTHTLGMGDESGGRLYSANLSATIKLRPANLSPSVCR